MRSMGRGTANRVGAYVYAFVGETGRDGGALFFGFGEEDGEFLDGRHGDVAPVVAGEECLYLLLLTKMKSSLECRLTLPFRSRKKTAEAIVEGGLPFAGLRWFLLNA